MQPGVASALVWDRDDAPPESAGRVLLWRSYSAGPGGMSVPGYLETNAPRLRAKYLGFIHDLGQSRLGGKRVVDHLALSDGFSFWWTTWLVEKSPLKSPRIYSCLRLLALEEILVAEKIASLELRTEDGPLAEAVEVLCRRLGIRYAGRGPAFRARLPHPVRGLLSFFKFLATRWPLRRVKSAHWVRGERTMFLCSYFTQPKEAAGPAGEYRSRYWAALPDLVRGEGFGMNWIHHYPSAPKRADVRAGIELLRSYNHSGTSGAHGFLESYLSPGVAARALSNWLRMNRARARLRGISAAFTPEDSAAWLWPLLREDWRTSLSGSVGAVNCLWIELFDEAMKDLPPQKSGLYLCENVSWEMAFLRAWRKHGHGRIVGLAHATVPFWHLYYQDDPAAFGGRRDPSQPGPDRLAINGPAAARTLAGAGYPAERLVEVEALRYLNLPRRAGPRPGRSGCAIIILGDVLPESMDFLLSMLEKAVPLLDADCRFSFKPHPLFPVDLSRYPKLRAETIEEPLERILDRFDLAVAANSTSAAVDALLAGLPVIVALSGGDLNLSPLHGEAGATFVGDARDLAEAVRAGRRVPAAVAERDDFFYLDPELPRWHRLFATLADGGAIPRMGGND